MIEQTILSNLLYDEDYTRTALPFLKDEYFNSESERLVFGLIDAFIKKYNAAPSREALQIELSNKTGINESLFAAAQEIISELNSHEQNREWLLEKTEEFCKDKALFLAINSSIKIYNGKDANLQKGAIPEILKDALAVSFDPSIGHDFIDDADARFEFYRKKEKKLPFDLELFNKITRGGLIPKSLTILLGGTGGFKTGTMCHLAATNLAQGHNVLYISMEMAEERIAERIDANLLDIPIAELETIPKEIYQRKLEKLRKKTQGKLIIKEYPTSSAGSTHFRYLLNELRLKRNFVPDLIYIDYINICASSRLKMGSNVNSYTYVKAIAEEIRGLAVEFNVPIISATQTNREGYDSSDPGLTNTSESFGLPQTADLMLALIQTEELEQMNQLLVKQLKNRYSDPGMLKRFVVGIDKTKMRLYDADPSAQDSLMNDSPPEKDKPTFDKSSFGRREEEASDVFGSGRKRKRTDFSDFK